MSPAENKMLGQRLSEARRGMPSPKRFFQPGQKRTMTVVDAVPLLNNTLEEMQSGVRVTEHTLPKIEQGAGDIPFDLAAAAERVYNLSPGRLTSVYQESRVVENGYTGADLAGAKGFLSAVADRKRVVVSVQSGGGSTPWRKVPQNMFDVQVFNYLKDTDVVQIDRPTFGYPKRALLAFDRSGDPQPGTLLLLRNIADPSSHAIRMIDPSGDPCRYVSDVEAAPLPPNEWEIAGWAMAWARPVGHGYPEWFLSELGLKPMRG